MPDVTVVSIIKTSGGDGFQGGKLTASASYIVQTQNGGTESIAKWAILNFGAPSGMLVSSINAANINRSPVHYQVDVQYEQPSWPDSQPNPLERRSLVSSSYEEFDEIFEVDVNDKPVLNSAGDRFSSAPTRRNGKLILQITKNLSSIPLMYYDSLKFTRNQGSVTIHGQTFSEGSLLFLPCTVQEQIEQQAGEKLDYFAVTYRLATDSNDHKITLSDMGRNEIDPDTGDKIPILDKYGQETTVDWGLDGEGRAILDLNTNPEPLDFQGYGLAYWGISFE